MITSILTSVKKVLGLDASYTAFDEDIIMHINSTFSKLHQLGVGPEVGFMIEDATPTWEELIGTDPVLNLVKSYTYRCVQQLFDPPPTSYAMQAVQEQIREMEWRISQYVEETIWVDPRPADIPEGELVLDGGQP